MGTHPEDHVVLHNYYGEQNLSFPSLLPTTNHVKPANDGPVLSSYPGLWKFEVIPDDVLENRCLTTCFSVILTSTISPSIVTIDTEGCPELIT